MTDKKYPPKIAAALHEVMEACGYVQKKKRNTFHNYNYAGEGDLLDVLRPAMLKAGLLLIPSGVDRSPVDEHGNTHVTVEYTLLHKDGDVWPDKINAFGSGNDKNSKGGIGDKGTYKALTGANKYLLFKLFQIETGDDPETDSHELEPPAPRDPPAARQQARVEAAPQPNPAFIVKGAKTVGQWVDLLASIANQAPDDATRQEIAAANGEALAKLKSANPTEYDRAMKVLGTYTQERTAA